MIWFFIFWLFLIFHYDTALSAHKRTDWKLKSHVQIQRPIQYCVWDSAVGGKNKNQAWICLRSLEVTLWCFRCLSECSFLRRNHTSAVVLSSETNTHTHTHTALSDNLVLTASNVWHTHKHTPLCNHRNRKHQTLWRFKMPNSMFSAVKLVRMTLKHTHTHHQGWRWVSPLCRSCLSVSLCSFCWLLSVWTEEHPDCLHFLKKEQKLHGKNAALPLASWEHLWESAGQYYSASNFHLSRRSAVLWPRSTGGGSSEPSPWLDLSEILWVLRPAHRTWHTHESGCLRWYRSLYWEADGTIARDSFVF